MPLPDLSFEKKLWIAGYGVVAGLDEVGRGALVGPVVAGCVAFSKTLKNQQVLVKINDSKQLTPKARALADTWIKKNALCWGVGESSVSEINRLGIVKATHKAFRRAIANSKSTLNYLLIDAFYAPYVRGLRRKNQKAIIKGDTKSLSIAAASIIAKVYRDKLMARVGSETKYKRYGWDVNKGYGTRAHQSAIRRYGITKLHRKAFVRRIEASS